MKASEAIQIFQESCKVGFLATSGRQGPRVRPMSPIAVEGTVLWMATCASSDKMAEISAHPGVEFCYMDADHTHLRLRGTAAVCEDAEIKRRMWDAYPLMHRYFKGADDPEYVLLKVDVAEALLMPSMSMEYERLEI